MQLHTGGGIGIRYNKTLIFFLPGTHQVCAINEGVTGNDDLAGKVERIIVPWQLVPDKIRKKEKKVTLFQAV